MRAYEPAGRSKKCAWGVFLPLYALHSERSWGAGDFSDLEALTDWVTKLGGVGFPNEAYASYNLGYTLLQLGSCSEAVPYLERAQQLEPLRHEPKDALKRTKHC